MKSSVILLKVIYTALLPIFEAAKITFLPKMTGYVGHDVKLPCGLIEAKGDKINQIQWIKETINILVSNTTHVAPGEETSLKGRVEISDQSLIIKDVKKEDGGSYTCLLSTYPHGSLQGNTILVVQDQMSLSSGVISAIVVCALLLLVIMAATAYLVLIRRPRSLARHHVSVDTNGSGTDPGRQSVIVRDQEVVYSDIKHKPSRRPGPSTRDKRTYLVHAEEVTYSTVAVL